MCVNQIFQAPYVALANFILFSRYLASSQQVFNSVLFILLVSVVICDVKAAVCASFSPTAGKPQFFLSISFKVRSSSDVFLGIYY